MFNRINKDYLRWIFGDVEWVKASLSQQSSLKIDVEDTVHIIMGFMPTTDRRKLIAAVNLDFIRHDTSRLCTAIGENGSLRWNGLTGVVSLYESGAKEWRELFRYQHTPDESYLAEWKNFISSINGITTTVFLKNNTKISRVKQLVFGYLTITFPLVE